MIFKKKILFISHDATRTGAPILLLNLAKALKEDYEIDFLLKDGGLLEDLFKEAGKTYFVRRKYPLLEKSRLLSKIKSKLVKQSFNLSAIEWAKYSFIVSNTITNGDILEEIRQKFKGFIISYIHELEMAARFFTIPENLEKLLKCSSAYFVPSKSVKAFLSDNFNVHNDKIALLHYYIPPPKIFNTGKTHFKEKFVVGGVGTSDWRKSPDLFIIVATLVFTMEPDANIIFMWKGASLSGVEIERLEYDVRRAGLERKISFIPASSNVHEFYESIDLLLLTSREDPYPLVVLEAASYKHPTICFDHAGGAPEFITASASGHISPFLNVNDVANKILFYYHHPNELSTEGERAYAKLNETHQNINYIRKQFEVEINNLTR